MNATLQSYLDLTETLGKLCQVDNSIDFSDCVKQLVRILQKVDEYRFFPLDLNREFIDSLKTPIQDWQTDRNELCHQLYISLATLLFRFEASNIYNRAYFDYMLENARTSLPYEIANEWGKDFSKTCSSLMKDSFLLLIAIRVSFIGQKMSTMNMERNCVKRQYLIVPQKKSYQTGF